MATTSCASRVAGLLVLLMAAAIGTAASNWPEQYFTSDVQLPYEERDLTVIQEGSHRLYWTFMQGTNYMNISADDNTVTFRYAPADRSWSVDKVGVIADTQGQVRVDFTPAKLATNSLNGAFDWRLEVVNAAGVTLAYAGGKLNIEENIFATTSLSTNLSGTTINWAAFTAYYATTNSGPYRAGTGVSMSTNSDGSATINIDSTYTNYVLNAITGVTYSSSSSNCASKPTARSLLVTFDTNATQWVDATGRVWVAWATNEVATFKTYSNQWERVRDYTNDWCKGTAEAYRVSASTNTLAPVAEPLSLHTNGDNSMAANLNMGQHWLTNVAYLCNDPNTTASPIKMNSNALYYCWGLFSEFGIAGPGIDYSPGYARVYGRIQMYDSDLALNGHALTGGTVNVSGVTVNGTNVPALALVASQEAYRVSGSTNALAPVAEPLSLHINGDNAMTAMMNVGGQDVTNVHTIFGDAGGVLAFPAAQPSVDWTGRKLYPDSGGVASFDWSTLGYLKTTNINLVGNTLSNGFIIVSGVTVNGTNVPALALVASQEAYRVSGGTNIFVQTNDDREISLTGTLSIGGTNVLDLAIVASQEAFRVLSETNVLCWSYAIPSTNWGPMMTKTGVLSRITSQAYSGGITASVYRKYWTNGWGNATLLGTMPVIADGQQSNTTWAVPTDNEIGVVFTGGATQDVVFSVEVTQ